ncbi:MAG TPA: hypothetical protein PLL00_10515 [Bacteroidia bacterium]|nr:hypothetical protein [Bacteroidia bacterium]
MKTRLLMLIICVTSSMCFNSAYAQDSTMIRKNPLKPRFIDRLYTGGNVGFQIGNEAYAEISPILGCRITDKFSAGIGFTYQYYRFKSAQYELVSNVFGGKVFGRYFFTNYLFGHGEFEHLNLDAFDFYPQKRRVDVESVLAGGGYFQRFSEASNSGLFAMILYNFTESAYTPYSNPIVRIGFNLGF